MRRAALHIGIHVRGESRRGGTTDATTTLIFGPESFEPNEGDKP
jgi:hypothetical protein